MVKENKIWLFKSVKHMIISIICFVLLLIGFIYVGKMDFKTDKPTDSEKFVLEHSQVPDDNIFTYVNSQDAYSYIKSSNVIMLFGVTDNDYVGHYAKILDEVAKEIGIEKVYYYDITQDREDNNATYESITNYLEDYLRTADNGKRTLYGPTLVVKKDGKIVLFDDETTFIRGKISADDYWTEEEVEKQKIILKSALQDEFEMEIEEENGEA